MPSTPAILTWSFLFAGMALFGSATPLSKLVVEQFPVFTASLFRVAIGAIVLLPFLGDRWMRIRALTRRDWLTVGAIALVGMFGFTTLLLHGMRLVPGVVGAIIMGTAPAVTAAGAVLFLSDHWNLRKVGSIALAVSGLFIVNGEGWIRGQAPATTTDPTALILGSALVFGAVCCEAGYTLIGKLATERLDPMLTVFLSSALAVPLFLVAAAFFEFRALDVGTASRSGWVALFAWGAGTLGLGSVLWYRGVQESTGTIAAGFMGVMPVSALVLSYVLLSEPVRTVHLAGFTVVFCGVLLMISEHARQARVRT